MLSDTAPNGGDSDSGPARGGDVNRRADDDQTAGGNAYTGSSGNVNGGDVVNEADDNATITNTGGSELFSCGRRCRSANKIFIDTAGTAGQSFTGQADGGDGEGRGPGGNAYTGYTGSSRGGNVVNSAGTITNTAAASEYHVLLKVVYTEDLLQIPVATAIKTSQGMPMVEMQAQSLLKSCVFVCCFMIQFVALVVNVRRTSSIPTLSNTSCWHIYLSHERWHAKMRSRVHVMNAMNILVPKWEPQLNLSRRAVVETGLRNALQRKRIF